MNEDRIVEEKKYHDRRFGGDDEARKSVAKYYSVRIKIAHRRSELLDTYCNGSKVLEYGCGSGTGSERLLRHGAVLTGFDISFAGIQAAKRRIHHSPYHANYCVMNAEKLGFADNTYDVVVGIGILHHLDLLAAYEDLARILKNDGHAIFEEPLGHNPLINLYRCVTPDLRTTGEHPLKNNDLKLLYEFFHNVQIEYFTLTTLLATPFRRMKIFTKIYNFLEKLDRALFTIPFLRKNAWTAIIHVSHPKKESF